MEKIKKALDMARSKKHSEESVRIYSHSYGQPNQAKDISYTKSRKISCDPSGLREKRVISGAYHDEILMSYKLLRTHVLQRLNANNWNTLAITSPTEGNGKTLTSINLAINLAREINHTVLLVDLDLLRPNIHSYFVDKEVPGISEYITEGLELSEILFNPGIERLLILPGNKPFINSSEILSSPKVVELVDELKNRYPNRIIIFDMPPLLSCDDMVAFAPYVDAIMLVVEEGETKKNDLKRAYEMIINRNIIGTVLNKSEDISSTFGYYSKQNIRDESWLKRGSSR